jgi:Fe-S-cluster containining protein
MYCSMHCSMYCATVAAMKSAVVPEEERDAHRALLAMRVIDDEATAARLQAVTMPLASQREELITAAQRARSTGARIVWLRAEVDLVGEAVAHLSPCRAGCSHCCNIAVTITRGEADHIAREINRKVANPPRERVLQRADLLASGSKAEISRKIAHMKSWTTDAYEGVPCTFLRGGECSIYPFRPLACRMHISVAPDDEPCRLLPGEPVRVPYADMRGEQGVYAGMFDGKSADLADLRDWFPSGEKHGGT